MKRVGVLAAASVAVLLAGCVPPAPVTPSPSPPTFMCTPEAGGAQAPCSEQQFQEMKAKDALYAEAEQVYRTYTSELIGTMKSGGASSMPPELGKLISGAALAKSALQRLQEVKAEKLLVEGGVQIVSARRLPTREQNGSVVAMLFCVDATRLTATRNGKKVAQGVTSEETVFFEGRTGGVTLTSLEFKDVSKC